MGSATKIDQTRRLATLLEMLRTQPLGSADISASLGVSQRCVQKDIATLREQNCQIERRAGRYHLSEHRGGHPLEHLALLCAVQLLEARGSEDQSWREAVARLKARLPTPMRQMLPQVNQKQGRGGRHLERLSQAVLEGRKIELRYESDPERWRTVSVQRLEIDPATGHLYAVVTELRAGVETLKTYRASRITDTRPTTEPADDWQGPIGRLGLTRQAELTLSFTASTDQTRRAVTEALQNVAGLEASGTWTKGRGKTERLQATLTAWVTDEGTPLLDLPWLLGWGASLDVQGPPEARKAFLRTAGRKG